MFRSSSCKNVIVQILGGDEVPRQMTIHTVEKEKDMRKNILALSAVLVLSSMILWGCSSNPSKDELKQLETTQAEITSLTQKASALRMEKASLQQAIKDKQSTLKTCQDEQAAVDEKLKSTN